MARNKTLALDSTDLHAAHVALAHLVECEATGTGVFGQYVKRETQEVRNVQGTVLFFQGDSTMSNGSVRLLTPEGERSFNLYGFTTLHV